MNIQFLTDPHGELIWASPALPGSPHDLTAARTHGIVAGLTRWAIACYADNAYDFARHRQWLRQRGITLRITRRGIDSSTRLGRYRWVVERTMAWLNGCRRLHRRYERTGDHFLAFAAIACTLVCCRCLAQ
ncbi:transposase [Thermomonospora amylolytica]|uniref:transposase n=1 Tax=Thermomonospora amylolytica TaxID=1411117 RepID=UPI001F45C664|nr:transposase [Thermomonospora amylolytica]